MTPDLIADSAEHTQALIQGETASIGVAQMQIGLAREIEEAGYATTRADDAARIDALLNDETAVEYIAGRAHQLFDLLHTTFPEFGHQSLEVQACWILIGFNQGWENWILRGGGMG